MMQVYLAGGTSKEWRERLEARWTGAEVVNPFRDSRQGAIYQFVADDLRYVHDSSLVFALCDYPQYTGTAAEFGYAHALGVPIIYTTTLPRVDSFLAAMSIAVFTDVEAAAEFAERRFPGLVLRP